MMGILGRLLSKGLNTTADIVAEATNGTSSSTGTNGNNDRGGINTSFLIIAGGALGVCVLCCLARFTCRRLDAHQNRAAIELSTEAADEPLLRNRRTCCNRFFSPQTTGSAYGDLKASATEVAGIVQFACSGGR
jgi:hypothetical protein